MVADPAPAFIETISEAVTSQFNFTKSQKVLQSPTRALFSAGLTEEKISSRINSFIHFFYYIAIYRK